jgi:hypothetical protein
MNIVVAVALVVLGGLGMLAATGWWIDACADQRDEEKKPS